MAFESLGVFGHRLAVGILDSHFQLKSTVIRLERAMAQIDRDTQLPGQRLGDGLKAFSYVLDGGFVQLFNRVFHLSIPFKTMMLN